MLLVRLGAEPSEVGPDIRAAVAAWGAGNAVLGGVALFGCTPPGCPRPLDAIPLLPRGIITITGADMPQPAMKLDAPLRTPWTVDGWPWVRPEGAVNPGLEAVEASAAVARLLQQHGAEPLPVATIVVVGPFADRVTQPTQDLHRGLRVVPPTTTTLLAAARELAVYERACSSSAAQHLLSVLTEDAEQREGQALRAEGFPATDTDLSTADTMLISKITDASPLRSAVDSVRASVSGIPPRVLLIAASVGGLVVLGLVTTLLLVGGTGTDNPPTAAGPISRVDGMAFTKKAESEDADCAGNAFGDVQAWLAEHSCTGLSRSLFTATVTERAAAVSVARIELADEDSAEELRQLLDNPGTGGMRDLGADSSVAESFDDAAQVVERSGNTVRVVRAVWSSGESDTEDVRLRALTERGLRLP